MMSAAAERRHNGEQAALCERKDLYVRTLKCRDDLLRLFETDSVTAAGGGHTTSISEIGTVFDALRLAVEEIWVVAPMDLALTANLHIYDLVHYWEARTAGEIYSLNDDLSDRLLRQMREDVRASRAQLATSSDRVR
jgi:hypothetical protein